ncbi:MAG: DUF6489 family protein [Pseudomonadota bacterium]
MRFTIDIDCTPEEARAFLGMPDVTPLNDMIVEEMTRRAKDNLDTLADPERLVKSWMELSGKGMDAFQGMMGAAMAGSGMGAAKPSGAGATKKKP